MSPSDTAVSERRIVLLLAAVQFVNILDFMIVMPLGPDFAAALGIATSHLGIVGGSYTAAASVAGLVGALFLDRFDRRTALAVAMAGLVTGTAAGAFARDLPTLVAARVVAGAFGGPATSIALSILADVVPAERRGKAVGTVMGAFAAASVVGVPVGLELARVGGWRLPFFAVAGLGAVVIAGAVSLMPPLRQHLDSAARAQPRRPLSAFLRDGAVLLSLLATIVVFMGGFSIIPNLSAYLQQNLHYPRAGLGSLYLVGGLVSFVAMRIGGAIVDRRGSVAVTAGGTILMLVVLAVGFVPAHSPVPVMVVFVSLMLANAIRAVALNTLATKVPPPAERARFMSTQSAVQHMAAAIGAMLSSVILSERPDGTLGGMPTLAIFAMVLAALVPFLVAAISARIARRKTAAPPATPPLATPAV
jgi:predicted MFS family arabinose efflux permease